MDWTTQAPGRLPAITFFHSDGCERQAAEPIADEAARRGIEVKFSDRPGERARIGVYCQHAIRPNADFSVTMLHDLAQRHDVWPAFWNHEPWSDFDVGILPGPSWTERWQTQSHLAAARPKLGVFELGWPKADLIYRDREVFRREAAGLRQRLGLKHARSVLYAPSWENHGKQDDFVRALVDLPVNLLLKQAPWSDAYPAVLENIRAMNARHRGCAPNVHIVDVDVSIMYCLGLADVLVSDESSVLSEALLLDVAGVAVTDWLIPDRNPPRPACVPFDFVERTTRARLRASVEALLDAGPAAVRERTRASRERHFSHLGQSASRIVDTIEAAVRGHALPHAPVAPQVDRDRASALNAERLVEQGRVVEAIEMLYPLAKAGTACWEVYNELGAVMFRLGDVGTAIPLLETAASRAADPVVALVNLTEAYCAASQADKALATLARLSRYSRRTPQDNAQAIRACMESMLAA